MENLPIIRSGKMLAFSEQEVKFNYRIKLYPLDENLTEWVPVQGLCSTRHIFNPANVEVADGTRDVKYFDYSGYEPDPEIQAQENAKRALRRAKAKLYDYIRCNLDLKYFVTLTYDGALVERENYNEVVKRFSQWADNAVRRKGLKYCGVVERHKKSNGLHFHLLCNSALDYVLSGTVKVPERKKPIKISTADRLKIPDSEWQMVYNVKNWKYGFSTALEVENDDRLVKVSHYLCKYLTKDFEKIGGRYYYSGGKLIKPRFEYCNKSFNDLEADTAFEIAGQKYKVVNFEK